MVRNHKYGRQIRQENLVDAMWDITEFSSKHTTGPRLVETNIVFVDFAVSMFLQKL